MVWVGVARQCSDHPKNVSASLTQGSFRVPASSVSWLVSDLKRVDEPHNTRMHHLTLNVVLSPCTA